MAHKAKVIMFTNDKAVKAYFSPVQLLFYSIVLFGVVNIPIKYFEHENNGQFFIIYSIFLGLGIIIQFIGLVVPIIEIKDTNISLCESNVVIKCENIIHSKTVCSYKMFSINLEIKTNDDFYTVRNVGILFLLKHIKLLKIGNIWNSLVIVFIYWGVIIVGGTFLINM
jgi:hypothetical protein